MRRVFAFLLAVSVALPATACLWDYDTLQMERQRFPGALELIVGKFLRHSDTFYEWRVEDRTAKIARHESDEAPLADKNLAAAYDDLAVALDKLGKHDEAIETIREKAEKLPNVGEYEAHANLGTFLVHSGRYAEGLDELRKTIAINPDAHFGREKYQVLLVEYLRDRQGDDSPLTLPLDKASRGSSKPAPFVAWLLEHQGSVRKPGADAEKSEQREREEIERALKGISGIMRFGDFRSPILLEATGDLLLGSYEWKNDGRRLAARAYLRAAEFSDSDTAKAAYREMAQQALEGQVPDRKSKERNIPNDRMQFSLTSLEDQLAREVKEADAWFKEVARDEELWVVASLDPDRRFWEKYSNQTVTVGHDRLPAGKFAATGLPVVMRVALGAGLALTVLVVVAALAWRKRRPTGYAVGERQA